jgi:hypothetical protein
MGNQFDYINGFFGYIKPVVFLWFYGYFNIIGMVKLGDKAKVENKKFDRLVIEVHRNGYIAREYNPTETDI